MTVTVFDLNQHRIIRLYFSVFFLSFRLDWGDISNIQDSVLTHYQTPRCASYFRLYLGVWKFGQHSLSCLIYYLLSKQYFLIQSPSERKIRLSGYGVELAVKKTEYKAVDDSKVQDDTEGKVQKTDEADDDEVEGFLFGKLRFVQRTMHVLWLQFF